MSQSEPHDEFLELCAISTSGQLSEEERRRLEEHLAVCESCREALREYEAVADGAIPAIAASEDADNIEDVTPGPGWSQNKAEKAFFERLANEEGQGPGKFDVPEGVSSKPQRLAPYPNGPTWHQVWLLYAAGILLFATLGFYAYRVRTQRRGDRDAPGPSQLAEQKELPVALEEQLSDAGHEREITQAEIRQRDKQIADLRRELAKESANITQMKAAQKQLENDLRTSQEGREDVAKQKTDLGHKLDAAANNSRTLEDKLDSLAEQSARDAARAKLLVAKNNELTHLLEDREAALERQDQLLAHDKDIRDLMGARDLYIAEVYDIARTGETKKPYGRVFYTRGKSLIFYAYDLDQEAEAKTANSFQAWGRRGPDRQQALNLGIFYEDNLARKRWILKCEDPKALRQIDGVFVTVEPNGGSHKPSGKSLLFAYLKLNPNHP